MKFEVEIRPDGTATFWLVREQSRKQVSRLFFERVMFEADTIAGANVEKMLRASGALDFSVYDDPQNGATKTWLTDTDKP